MVPAVFRPFSFGSGIPYCLEWRTCFGRNADARENLSAVGVEACVVGVEERVSRPRWRAGARDRGRVVLPLPGAVHDAGPRRLRRQRGLFNYGDAAFYGSTGGRP